MIPYLLGCLFSIVNKAVNFKTGRPVVYLRESFDHEIESDAGGVAILEAGQQETSEGLLQRYQEAY